MANPKDFLARQIRTTQIIASGGVGFGSGAGLIIYSASNSSDLIGGIKDSVMLSKVGKDVFFFISGSQGSKSARNDPSNGDAGVTLFGGDVTVSGTLYAERMIVEVDMATTGTVMISGSLFVSRSASIGGGLDVNKYKEGRGSDDFVHHGASGSRHIITSHASSNQVLILSGGNLGTTSPNEFLYSDLAFFVSGAVGSKNTRNKGVAVFGGDVAISGTVYGGNSNLNFGHSLLPSINNTFDIGSATFAWKDIYLQGNAYFTDSASIETAAGRLILHGHEGVEIDADGSGDVEINVTAGDDILIGNDAVAADIILGSSITTTSKVQTKSVVVEIDAGTGGVDIDSAGRILIDGGGTSNLTINGGLTISGSTALFLHSDGGEIDITSNHGAVDINAAANSSFSTTAGEIAIEAATGVIINGPSSITLDSDAKQIIIADNTVERGRIIADANLTISSSAGNDLAFDSNSGDFRFQKASAETLRIKNDSDDVVFQPRQTGKDIVFQAQNSNQEIARFDSDKEVLAINTNKKLTFDGTTSQSERISGDGTNLSIDSSNKVLILSGGSGATSINEASYTDTNFFVSGSLNSRQYPGKPGTSVFGGDMVVSGGIHLDYFATDFSSKLSFANPQKTYIKVPGTNALDISGNSVRIGANISEVSAYNPVDTNFFVSGAIDSKGKTANKGTSTFGGDVVISGSLYAEASNSIFVSEYIKCSRDTNSYIRFNGSDTIQFRAGGVTFAQLFEGTNDLWQINPDGNDVDLEVFADGSTRAGKYLIRGDAGNSQVLILSGGGGTSPNESLYPDLGFFVSGSINSKNTTAKGTSAFGGDVVVSGALYLEEITQPGTIGDGTVALYGRENPVNSGITKLFFKNESGETEIVGGGAPGGSDTQIQYNNGGALGGAADLTFNDGTGDITVGASTADAKLFFRDAGIHLSSPADGKLGINSDGQVLIMSGGGPNGANESLYSDTNFFVSGTIGSKGTPAKGTSVFGGDTVISGGLYVNETIFSADDIDTKIVFSNDQIDFFAGNERLLKLDEAADDEVVIGDGGDVNFRVATKGFGYNLYVKSDHNAGADNAVSIRHASPQEVFHVSGSTRIDSEGRENVLFISGTSAGPHSHQVLILSGGHPTDVNESLYTDLAFFVSGSAGSRGTTKKGTAVFGGDIFISGSSFIGPVTIETTDPTITFKEDRVLKGTIGINSSDNILIENSTINKHIVMKVNDAGNVREAFRVDGAIAEVVVNQGADSLVDFRVESVAKTHALYVDGSTSQVLILSGGGANGTNESLYSDTNFFVSGSLGSRQKQEKATAVFGGDLVVSGGLHLDYASLAEVRSDKLSFGNPLKTYIKTPGLLVLDLSGDNVRIGANISETSQYNPPDTNFFVSGSIGKRTPFGSTHGKSTAVFGGDVVISGSVYSKQTHVQRLGWAGSIANASPRFPSFNGFGTTTTPDVENFIPVLGSGSLRQLDLWASEGSTATIAVSLFVNGDVVPRAEISGSFVQNNILGDGDRGHLTIDFADAFQKANFLSGSNSFEPGDLFSIGISKLAGSTVSNIIGILHYETDMLFPHSNKLGGLPG